MTEVTALDRAKTAYYESAQATLNDQPLPISKEDVDAIYASLSEDELNSFGEYMVEVDATLYDFLMSDQSSQMRAAIDLFIQDNVNRIHGDPAISQEDRREVIGKLGPMEAFQAMSLIQSDPVQGQVIVKLLNMGMTHEQIAERIAVMNAAEEAKTATKAA
jgi:hypothetical protein